MHRGYTKRWRKRWDKGYHKDPLMWVLMDYFIDFATYKDKEVFKKGTGKIKLKRGQWHFTYRELAKFMAVNPRRIRTCMSMLSKVGFSTLEPTHLYTIVTVIKYDTYQPIELMTDTQKDTDQTHDRHTVDTLLYNTKKGNKVKKVNNTKACAWPKDFSLTDEKIKYAVENGIAKSRVTDFFADFEDWARSKGATYKDWDAAFRNRVRKAQEYGRQFLTNPDRQEKGAYTSEDAHKRYKDYMRMVNG